MEDDIEYLLSEDEHTLPSLRKPLLPSPKASRENILVSLLVLLLALNALQLCLPYLHKSSSTSSTTTTLSSAGLTRNIEIPRRHDTLYSINPNLTLRDQLWESIDINTGIVALDQSYIREQKLPPSMEFPWEPSKNVYSTTAHHQLHCLVKSFSLKLPLLQISDWKVYYQKNLYKSVSQFFAGENQTENQWHLMHCLDSLRQDVLCNADDTLFFVYEGGTHHPKSGDGQSRMCKNFTALQEWAKPRTACYAFSQSSNASFNGMEKEHFRRCPVPEGEIYLDQVREYFGVGEEWLPNYKEV